MDIGKLIGGILLVTGTTIGAALLGLPATCAFMGFYPTVALFVIIWLFMLGAGVYFVDLSCDLKKHTNLISMAEKKLGRWGMAVSWISYLLLLYSLMALYISGSAPLFQNPLSSILPQTNPITPLHLPSPSSSSFENTSPLPHALRCRTTQCDVPLLARVKYVHTCTLKDK